MNRGALVVATNMNFLPDRNDGYKYSSFQVVREFFPGCYTVAMARSEGEEFHRS